MTQTPHNPDLLRKFVQESNRIEGIHRSPTNAEIEAHLRFMALDLIDVEAMEEFVREVAAVPLRERKGMDVRVGGHLPPPGGPTIRKKLATLLHAIYDGDLSPYEAHVEYERLHPFLDGNGRSGRVLWAWHMQRDGVDPFAIPFLHRWYYQSLDASRSVALASGEPHAQ